MIPPIHIYPVNDIHEHKIEGDDCWCAPLIEWEGEQKIVIHNAADKREYIEQLTNEFDDRRLN